MGKDKLYHLIAGFVIAFVFGLVSPFWGLVAGITAGLAKDIIWDLYLKKGMFEVLDIFVTVIGAIFGVASAILTINYIL
jgi:hypothetical protein